MTDGRLLRVTEAARYLGVSPNTLRKWSDEGRVRTARMPGSDHRRYTIAELDRVRREVLGIVEEEQTG